MEIEEIESIFGTFHIFLSPIFSPNRSYISSAIYEDEILIDPKEIVYLL
jgi:hypothetical protein